MHTPPYTWPTNTTSSSLPTNATLFGLPTYPASFGLPNNLNSIGLPANESTTSSSHPPLTPPPASIYGNYLPTTLPQPSSSAQTVPFSNPPYILQPHLVPPTTRCPPTIPTFLRPPSSPSRTSQLLPDTLPGLFHPFAPLPSAMNPPPTPNAQPNLPPTSQPTPQPIRQPTVPPPPVPPPQPTAPPRQPTALPRRAPQPTPSQPAPFQCHHPDCLRSFLRKTSLTNHLKAHLNYRSRSIYRTKRARVRAAALQAAAAAAAAAAAGNNNDTTSIPAASTTATTQTPVTAVANATASATVTDAASAPAIVAPMSCASAAVPFAATDTSPLSVSSSPSPLLATYTNPTSTPVPPPSEHSPISAPPILQSAIAPAAFDLHTPVATDERTHPSVSPDSLSTSIDPESLIFPKPLEVTTWSSTPPELYHPSLVGGPNSTIHEEEPLTANPIHEDNNLLQPTPAQQSPETFDLFSNELITDQLDYEFLRDFSSN
eukprot:GFKZ01002173.1.p1 GENE.GFKZ01002173.1~~GFKZ01002173.1.p1  ORF type:complete len:547 (-),score=39.13 GFKZ01002173.1:1600-3060(-)